MINFKKVVSMVVMLSLMLGACGKNPARRDEEINSSLAGALTDNGNGGAIVKKEGTFSECWDEVNPWGGKRKSEGLIEYFRNLFFPNPTWSALWGTVIPLVSLAIAEILIYRDNSSVDSPYNLDYGWLERQHITEKINDDSTKWWQKLWYGTRSTRWWHRAIKINVCGWLAAGWVTGQTVAKDSAGHDWLGKACIGIVYGSSTGLSGIIIPALAVAGGEFLIQHLYLNTNTWDGRKTKTMVRSFTFGMLAGGVLAGGIATKNSVAAGDRWWTTLGKGFWQSAAGFLSLGLTTGAIGSVVAGIVGVPGWIREKKEKAETHERELKTVEDDRQNRKERCREEREGKKARREQRLQAKREQDAENIEQPRELNWGETFKEQKETLLQAIENMLNAQYERKKYVNEKVLPKIDELDDLLEWANDMRLIITSLSKDEVANIRKNVTQEITNTKEVIKGELEKVRKYGQVANSAFETANNLLPDLRKRNAANEVVKFVEEFASEGNLKELQEKVNTWNQKARDRLNPFKNYVRDNLSHGLDADFVKMMTMDE